MKALKIQLQNTWGGVVKDLDDLRDGIPFRYELENLPPRKFALARVDFLEKGVIRAVYREVFK